MKIATSRWMVYFGIFLFACGVFGFLSNPAKAQTALFSGALFGSISLTWGMLMKRGAHQAWWGAIGTTGFLCLVFTWRAIMSWLSVAQGQPKELAAILITVMLLGSALTTGFLWLRRAERLG
ncbi:MAG: hypothetical protein SH807_08695 [Blastochloris sp.]|nr:hypothetical protein [Blastochloris sp.]